MSSNRTVRAEPGVRLGSYRLVARLGAGGMGEVWRARDTALSRDVAIKLLSAGWTRDADRLARFENEARAVALLNHPNVLTVFAVGREDDVPYLVTEVLDGRTLRNVLAGGALPLDRSVDWSMQIANGLAAAHDKGIVHRDLKPANIFVTSDGRVKILDFGIARITQPIADAETRLETTPGVLIGTAGYMAPEQVRGEQADHRADIFALGAVLYEMVTAQQAFPGAAASDVIDATLTRDPISSANMPPAIDRIIRHCLEKDPNRRYRSAHDLAFQLESARESSATAALPARSPAGAARQWATRILGAGGLLAAGWVGATLSRDRTSLSANPPVRRFSIALSEPMLAGEQTPFALSPDSSQIAYVLNTGGAPTIWVRSLNELAGHPIPGTEHGFAPFFSPDGQTLAYFTRDQLMRVPVAGGPPVRLVAVPPVTRGGVWAPDGWIYFSQSPSDGIVRIRAEGGAMETVTQKEATERYEGHVWPDVSADGRFLLFTARRGDSFEESHLTVRWLSTGETRVLGKGGTSARFGPSDRILFVRGATLFAASFDSQALALRGLPEPILGDVQADPTYGGAWYGISRDGTLAYAPGDARPFGNKLLWVAPSGGETAAFGEERTFGYPVVSPDGRSVLVTIDGMHQDLWRFEVGGAVLKRLTSSPGEDFGPIWSPDGRRMAYTAIRHGRPPAIFVKAADGPDGETQLFSDPNAAVFPNAWSLAADVLLATAERVTAGMRTVQLFALGSSGGAPRSVLPSRHDHLGAALSPDGQRVAFVSFETGAAEVFVGQMPDGRNARQVSVGGGTGPVWARDGRRLFYRHDDAMMAIDMNTGDGRAMPRVLFRGNFEEPARPDWSRNFDVAPDGRFLMVRQTYKPAPRTIVIVLGWQGGTLETAR